MINLKRAARSASLLLAMALAMPAAGAPKLLMHTVRQVEQEKSRRQP